MPITLQSQTDPAAPTSPTPNTPTMACYTGYEIFPKPPPRVIPLTTFGKPKSCFEGVMTDDVRDLLHAQYKLSLLQWNAGAARRQPTQLVTAMCGAFNQFQVHTNDDDLAILLNRYTFLSDAIKYPIIEESTSKTTWGLKALVVRGHLRRPPIGASKTITLCTVHLHNVVAKKRDAATALLPRLFAHMKLLEVDFVGGDFNRAAKSIVPDVFSDSEFMAPGSVPLWGAGGPEGDDTDCILGSCICLVARSTGSSTSTGSTRLPMNNWASARETKARTTQSLCTFGQPTSREAPERYYEATQPNRGGSSRQQQRTGASANDAGTRPQPTRRIRQQVQPQRESCGLPHLRVQSTHTMSSSDALLIEAQS